VGLRRSVAIIAGLSGVVLIVKPSPSTFTIYEAFALTIVFSLAIRDIITRRIPGHVPSLIVALANAGFVTMGGLALGFIEGMRALSFAEYATLAVAAAFLAIGYVFMVLTLRTGELSATAPFRYTIVVFAILSGVFVFNELPDGWAVLGIVMIVASGLYAAHREARLSRIARMSTQSAT
jgi:drug/metabolite transporter (DMT)-like permease